MEVLRTPEERFVDLARYPFVPKYEVVDAEHDLLMHFVDQGPRDAPTILMLHGEPTWSYLYRHQIMMLAEAGYRVVAPDLIGFGRSDKPAAREDYTYASHVRWTWSLCEKLELERIVLVCHDWGGLIGLRLVAEHPEHFARVVACNTFLPTGETEMPEAFFRWRDMSQSLETLDVGIVVQSGSLSRLSESVLEGYRAPFPDESYMAGVREFPMMVPVKPDDPGAAENIEAWKSLETFKRPVLVAFSDSDPITAGAGDVIHQRIPGASEVEPVTIEGASHFLQEDRGPELAGAILDFLEEFPLARAAAPVAPSPEPEPTASAPPIATAPAPAPEPEPEPEPEDRT